MRQPGYRAFDCSTCLNQVRQESQSSQAMKSTQNSTLSGEEISEESEKVVAFAAEVERFTTESVSRGSDISEDESSCKSSLAPSPLIRP